MTTAAEDGFPVLEFGWEGSALAVHVGPAVVSGGHTVLRLRVSSDSETAVWLGSAFGWGIYASYLLGIRLLSLKEGFALREVGKTVEGLSSDVARGEDVELFPVFGGLPDGVGSVDVFLPNVGVALGVPVVDAGEAGFDVDAALAGAEIDESIESGPFELNSVVVAADGSSDTEKDADSTTVNVSGDVLFAIDSAELSGGADGVLEVVVERLGIYPSGGKLVVTGHTDDVNTDEHNQDLSERRAKAVSDRLGELTDLSGWETVVSGKGESEPRVPNDSDENRQLNRRVEVLLTPADPGEAAAVARGSSDGSGQMPEATGPVGRGPDGVGIEVDGVPARISLDSVTRIGDYITGTIKITAEQDLEPPVGVLALPGELSALTGWNVANGAAGFTLLDGMRRHLIVDYTDPSEGDEPLTVDFLYTLKQGDVRCFPAVWPGTGGDVAILDIVGGVNAYSEGDALAVRLTDIPILDE